MCKVRCASLGAKEYKNWCMQLCETYSEVVTELNNMAYRCSHFSWLEMTRPYMTLCLVTKSLRAVTKFALQKPTKLSPRQEGP